jgi:hypothetical protein
MASFWAAGSATVEHAAAPLTPPSPGGYGRGVPPSPRIDAILSTLNATEVGTLDSIAAKMRQVQEELAALGQPALAERAGESIDALGRGDLAEFKRGRAFLQSKIGHLR